MTLNDQINWDDAEYSFLKECVSTCNARNAPLRNAPTDEFAVSSKLIFSRTKILIQLDFDFLEMTV